MSVLPFLKSYENKFIYTALYVDTDNSEKKINIINSDKYIKDHEIRIECFKPYDGNTDNCIRLFNLWLS